MNMKDTTKYKLFSTLILAFIAIISLTMGFFVGSSRTSNNIAYWIFKSIAIVWIVVEIILLWTLKRGIGSHLILAILGFLIQFVPILLRIGFTSENEYHVPVGIIYFAAILDFIFLCIGIFFTISANTFKKSEDKAKLSSNH